VFTLWQGADGACVCAGSRNRSRSDTPSPGALAAATSSLQRNHAAADLISGEAHN
jgi:hypothetical protein